MLYVIFAAFVFCFLLERALPGDLPEVPDAPEPELGLRPAREQRREGLDLADLDAGGFFDHLARVA